MKRSNHHGEALALILAAGLCAFTPGLAAQSRDTPPKQGEQQQDQQQSLTYTRPGSGAFTTVLHVPVAGPSATAFRTCSAITTQQPTAPAGCQLAQ